MPQGAWLTLSQVKQKGSLIIPLMRSSIFNSQNKISCIPSKERGRPLVILKGDDSTLDKYGKNDDGDTSEGSQAEHSFPMKLSLVTHMTPKTVDDVITKDNLLF